MHRPGRRVNDDRKEPKGFPMERKRKFDNLQRSRSEVSVTRAGSVCAERGTHSVTDPTQAFCNVERAEQEDIVVVAEEVGGDGCEFGRTFGCRATHCAYRRTRL